jgi:hypothetical protein
MKYRKKPVVIEATVWEKNGDHPEDYQNVVDVILHDGADAEYVDVPEADARARGWEGAIVRYFRSPGVSGKHSCKHCEREMNAHGWIDSLEGGHIVCPGDWIIRGVKGELYPCKPDIFAATYEAVEEVKEAL